MSFDSTEGRARTSAGVADGRGQGVCGHDEPPDRDCPARTSGLLAMRGPRAPSGSNLGHRPPSRVHVRAHTRSIVTTVASALPDLHPEHCPFCGIIAGRLTARRILEDERTLAFLDVNPATHGHVLVVPRRHALDLLAVPTEDLAACAIAAQQVAALQVERLGAKGVNVFNACGRAAWQTVPHLHLHVVPRYDDDALRPPWLSRPASATELDATARALR